jgi:hypothetical protein
MNGYANPELKSLKKVNPGEALLLTFEQSSSIILDMRQVDWWQMWWFGSR